MELRAIDHPPEAASSTTNPDSLLIPEFFRFRTTGRATTADEYIGEIPKMPKLYAYPELPNEAERVAALHALNVLDTPPEIPYDRIVDIAARVCGAPIALVSLVDHERQWFKARKGVDITETPRCVSFCAHAIASEEPLVVCDASTDPRFEGNPLVTGFPSIRFYAGAPLFTHEGQPLGTLCVIDTCARPRPSDAAMQTLSDLAVLVVEQMEYRAKLTAHLRAVCSRNPPCTWLAA